MLNELLKIGLSENEAKVYLALLELGSATAQEIAKKATVNRPTTYVQLEMLMKIGLVSTFEKATKKGGAEKTFFRAEDPEHLKKVVAREKILLEEKTSALEKTLPDLERIFTFAGDRPKVRFLEGLEGSKIAQDEFLKAKTKEVFSISSGDHLLKIFPTHPEEYSPRRVKAGIHTKLIYTSSKGAFLKENDQSMLREARFLSREKFPFSSDFVVYDDRVQITALTGKPYVILIQSAEIAESMKAIFNVLWKSLEKR